MKPWDIIGWTIIITPIVFLSLMIGGLIAHKCYVFYRYWRSRNIQLKVGQQWQQDSSILYIEHKYSNCFGIKSGSASWGETQAAFNRRKKNRLCYLIKD